MIGKKGASGRKDYRHSNILIHKREILLSYEQRGGHIGTWVWDERNQVRGYLLCQKRQTLAGKEAMLCGDGCKYLQTFEAKDANV